ncbi:MAG: alcohol dehydrogenase catalytic domain-containing protein [Armatimonadota bacterium]
MAGVERKVQAVILRGPGRLEVTDIPEPPLGPGHVLVRVQACGICGSDLRYLRGENPWSQHTLGLRLPSPPDMVLGHEFAGDIVRVSDASLETRLGERVAVLAYRGCGACFYCQRGQPNLCADTAHIGHGAGWGGAEYNPGGMAELCPVWSEMAYLLPSSISYDEATLLDGAAVAVHAVTRAEVAEGDWVVVIGCGPIGLLALQVARARGARVVATDIASGPLALAAELGAKITVPAEHGSIAEAVVSATDGIGAAAVLNSVGTPRSITDSMQLLRACPDRLGEQYLPRVPRSHAPGDRGRGAVPATDHPSLPTPPGSGGIWRGGAQVGDGRHQGRASPLTHVGGPISHSKPRATGSAICA